MSSPTFCCAKADLEAPAGLDEPSTSSVDGSFGDSSLLGLQLRNDDDDVGGNLGTCTSTPLRSPALSEQFYDALEKQQDHATKNRKSQQLLLELHDDSKDPDYWEDIGVVEFLDRRLGTPDESTPEQRCQDLREVLAETDILEARGDVSDFLFHVARTKHGKVYIRVIRTMLLNRGMIMI